MMRRMKTSSHDRAMLIDEAIVPRFIYGTAWKEDDTARLTELALRQGFRAVDTANQRKHYHEQGAGEGIARAIAAGIVTRDALFLQTKFTFRRGQDHRLPYDPAAPIARQVEQSFALSLQHLGTEYIDSYVLHGPSTGIGLAADDWAAWRAMEEIAQSSRARQLGVSNVSVEQLEMLCGGARIQPSFVQNRCYAVRGWDLRVREFCAAHGIVYQGFSLLTANPKVTAHPELARLAARYGKHATQIVFRFALEIGILPLTGTKSPERMRADLDALAFRLAPGEIATIRALQPA